MDTIDVYAYGVISSSTLHLLSTPFPSPDGYGEIVRTYRMTGGEALNSSIVLSRWGLRVLLDGNWIGDTAEGRHLLETIQAYHIDAHRLTVKPGDEGVNEIVFSDEHSRTIFGNYIDLLSGAQKWNSPQKTDIQRAKIVCIDPPFGEESVLAGRYAAQLGIPFVSIDCPSEHELSTEAETIIISGEFRDRVYPQVDLEELFAEYQRCARGLVVFTAGSNPILFGRQGERAQRFDPYPVKVIDSAGAGDTFRAGMVYGLLRGWEDGEMVRYATAAAGMVCARFPGVLNSPSHNEVMQFVQARAGK